MWENSTVPPWSGTATAITSTSSLGGQIRGEQHRLYLVYPQGNPLSAAEELPYLQIGETKYGRPILDRGIRYDRTSLEEATKFALISLD